MRFTLNLLILCTGMAAAAFCLWLASHQPWYWSVPAIIGFALINNLPFSMMHEAVHGVAAKSAVGNRLLGVIGGWAYPTSFLLQRQAHLGHHERNRGDGDLYDYYLPHQSRLQRNLILYCGNLFGLYYVCVVFSNLLYLLASGVYKSARFRKQVAARLGFGPYIDDIAQLPSLQIWLEIVLAFGYQACLFWLLQLNVWSYLLCMYAFGLHWSVLQYATHAWSSRDVRNGAWNLKVLPASRWVALNYHYHQAHHQHPTVPWYALPRLVDPGVLQPSFWRVYFSLWKGVRPAPPMGAPADLAFLFPKQEKAQQQTDQ